MSKYRNIKTKVDGIMFDSKKEAGRYCELKILAKTNKIKYLELQPKLLITVNGYKICKYIGDFSYTKIKDGKAIAIVEDVKGIKTPIYRLKKKLVKALYDIDIKEV